MKKLTILITLLIVIQFIPYGKNHTNPNIIQEPNWDSSQTKQLFLKTCGDCHSYETKYPWYADIAPLSWVVQFDINLGRKHLNISSFDVKDIEPGKVAITELEENEMPPLPYKLVHSKSKLSYDEKIQLIKGLKNTFEN